MTHPWDMVAAAGALASLGFVLELGWPWLRAGLRKRCEAKVAAKEEAGEEESKNKAIASNRTVTETSTVRNDAAKAVGDAQTASVQCPLSSVQEDPGKGQRTGDNGQRQGAQDVGRLEGQTEADRLWEEARRMTHNFKPDLEKDKAYLSKICAAARLGHLEAMAKLGEYAFRRKAFVEAYYWTALAELKGAKGLERTLRNIRSSWLAAGCPAQRSNTYDGFSEQQGSFARALLRIHCAVGRPVARARLKELADRGVPEAQLFLGKGTAPAK